MKYEWTAINNSIDALCRADGILDVLMEAHPDAQHGGLVGALWAVQRELDYVKHVLEDECERDLPPIPAFLRVDDGQMELPMEDGDGETDDSSLDESDAEEEQADGEAGDSRLTRSSFLNTTLSVDWVKDNEDGSAVYKVEASDEEMQRLFEVFFIRALIEGIRSVERSNDRYIKLTAAAEDLERFLRVWEVSDTLDYDPEVKARRVALTEALAK